MGHQRLAQIQRERRQSLRGRLPVQSGSLAREKPGRGMRCRAAFMPPPPLLATSGRDGPIADDAVKPGDHVLRPRRWEASLTNASCTTSSGARHHCRAYSAGAAACSSTRRPRRCGSIISMTPAGDGHPRKYPNQSRLASRLFPAVGSAIPSIRPAGGAAPPNLDAVAPFLLSSLRDVAGLGASQSLSCGARSSAIVRSLSASARFLSASARACSALTRTCSALTRASSASARSLSASARACSAS